MNTYPTVRRIWGRPQTVSTTANQRLLQCNEVWRPEISRPLLLTCTRGRCWITRTGDATDYLLEPGMTFTAQPRQAVVIQALQPGTRMYTSELP